MPIKTIELSDTTINVRIEGSGEPVLFIHGFPLDHSMWEHQLGGPHSDLADSYQLIAPDLRGFGSNATDRDVITMGDFADDLIELVNALGVTAPINVCGLSMGGYIAFQLLAKLPERIGRLILCDTRSAADTPEVHQNRFRVAETVLNNGMSVLAGAMLEKLVSDTTRDEQPETVSSLRTMMTEADPKAVAAASKGMAERPDVTGSLAEISQPTLVVCGAFDAITPPDEMQQIANTIPNATWAEIPLAGHMAPMEQPAAFNQHLHNFLAST